MDDENRGPAWRLARCRLRLSNFNFKVIYRPGLVKKVPEALSKCTPEDREEEEVEDEIITFEVSKIAITRAQQKSGARVSGEHKEESRYLEHDGGQLPEENEYQDEKEMYQEEDKAITGHHKVTADVPLPIKIQEVIKKQSCDDFCQKAWANEKKGERKFYETEDGVIRGIPPEEQGAADSGTTGVAATVVKLRTIR